MKNSLVVLFFVFSLVGNSQSQYSLSLSNVVISDTVYMGSVLGYSLEIKNSGTDTICWPVEVFISVNSSYIEPCVVFFFDESCFAPGDVLTIDWPTIDTINSTLDGGYLSVSQEKSFVEGENVIVVWPAVSDTSGGPYQTEQFLNVVYAIDNTTDVEESVEQQLHLSFNDRNLIIQSPHSQLHHYELYDLMGRKVLEGQKPAIDTSNLKGSVYVLSVLLKDGTQQTVKVILP